MSPFSSASGEYTSTAQSVVYQFNVPMYIYNFLLAHIEYAELYLVLIVDRQHVVGREKKCNASHIEILDYWIAHYYCLHLGHINCLNVVLWIWDDRCWMIRIISTWQSIRGTLRVFLLLFNAAFLLSIIYISCSALQTAAALQQGITYRCWRSAVYQLL